MTFTPDAQGVINGTAGDDKIVWQNEEDWKRALTVNAGNGADTIDFRKSSYKNTLWGDAGNDIIYGGAGADTIYGAGGTDIISGGKGNDKIYAGNGNDTITGGKGNDLIYTEGGNNTVIFNTGDGADTIYKGVGSDTVQFNNFATIKELKNGLTLSKSGYHLVLNYTDADKVILSNYYKNGQGTSVATLKAKDGSTISLAEFYDSFNNKIYGEEDAENTISGTVFNDTIYGGNLNDTISASDGNDKIYGYAGNDLLKGGAGNDTIAAGDGDDTIYGGDGDDVITGGKGNDIIYSGTGDDIVNGGSGKNTIYIKNNEGTTTIQNGGGADTVVFSNVASFDALSFAYDGNDLHISANESTAILKNYKTVNHSAKYIKTGNTTYNLTDVIVDTKNYSTALMGTDGDDILVANNYTYEIDARQGGNDILVGKDGGNCWAYRAGEGNNTIYAADRGNNDAVYTWLNSGNDTLYTTTHSTNLMYVDGGGNDTIYWRGGSLQFLMYNTQFNNIFFTQEVGTQDVTIRYGNNSAVTINDYFEIVNPENEHKFYLSAESGDSSIGIIINDVIEDKGGVKNYIEGTTGTDEADYIIGTDKKETIYGNAGDDAIVPNGGNDTIVLGDGDDILIAGAGNKTINATSGNNIINLGAGNNTAVLGTDSDVVYSGTGTNTIRFLVKDTGSDIYNYANGNDTLDFRGDDLSGLSIDIRDGKKIITRLSNEKTVTINNLDSLTEGLTVKDKNAATSTLFNLSTTTGDSTATTSQEFITGTGHDVIYTGLGNDNIEVSTGNNSIYLQKAAGGNNNIYTYQKGVDTFMLPEEIGDYGDVRLIMDGDDLIVAYTGDVVNNTVVIKNFESKNAKYIKFKTQDAPAKKLTELISENGVSKVVYGTDENDKIDKSTSNKGVVMYGLKGNDTLTGSNYNDYLNGSAGKDTLIGGKGNDVYEIDSADWGKGQNVITDAKGDNDTLRINTTPDKINLFFDVVRDGTYADGNAGYTTGKHLYINSDKNYTIKKAKASDGVKITNYFTTNGKIENIIIPDGNNWVNAFGQDLPNIIGQLVANFLYKNGYNSTDEVIASGNEALKAELEKLYKPLVDHSMEKNHIFYGTDDDDILVANEKTYQIDARQGGNDVLVGYEGGDCWAYNVSTGNNTIYAANKANRDPAYIWLGNGNDTLYTTTNTLNLMYVDGGGNSTIYWRGGNSQFLMYNTPYENITFERPNESDNLIINYGDNKKVTIADYYDFIYGNDYNSDKLYLSAKDGDSTLGRVLNDAIAERGGAGNDIYMPDTSIQSSSYVINDNGGYDVLNLKDDSDSTYLLFNVKQNGTFDAESDKLLILSQSDIDTLINTGDLPENVGVMINDFDSIERINTQDTKYADTASLNTLKSEVAGWLGSDGRNYADVIQAMKSGDDVSGLIAIFSNPNNWQTPGLA